MTTRDMNAFMESLLSTGSYRTPQDHRPPLLDRLFGRSDRWYHFRLALILLSGSLLAYMGRFNTWAWMSRAHKILRLIEHCGGKITITGARHIAELNDKPVVYACNHMSLVETMLVPEFLLQQNFLAVVVKDSLLTYPFFGKVMRETKAIGVSRDNPREDLKAVLVKGEAALREGRSVLIFPQSTRSTGFDPEAFNSLACKLAKRVGTSVVPVAVKTDFQQTGKRIKDFGPVDRSQPLCFAFGEAMAVDKNSREVHESVVQFIKTHLEKWNRKPADKEVTSDS